MFGYFYRQSVVNRKPNQKLIAMEINALEKLAFLEKRVHSLSDTVVKISKVFYVYFLATKNNSPFLNVPTMKETIERELKEAIPMAKEAMKKSRDTEVDDSLRAILDHLDVLVLDAIEWIKENCERDDSESEEDSEAAVQEANPETIHEELEAVHEEPEAVGQESKPEVVDEKSETLLVETKNPNSNVTIKFLYF